MQKTVFKSLTVLATLPTEQLKSLPEEMSEELDSDIDWYEGPGEDPGEDPEVARITMKMLNAEDRLELLDMAIEKHKAQITTLFQQTSDLTVKIHNRYASTDEIAGMEKLEEKIHRMSMKLSAYFVERSRHIRTMLGDRAALYEVNPERHPYGDNEDSEFMLEEERELTAVHKAFMARDIALEKHVTEEGNKEIADSPCKTALSIPTILVNFIKAPGGKGRRPSPELGSVYRLSSAGWVSLGYCVRVPSVCDGRGEQHRVKAAPAKPGWAGNPLRIGVNRFLTAARQGGLAHSISDSEFVLQYDGDNLVPNNVKLLSGKGHLKLPQLDELPPVKGKGKKRPDVKTLKLSSKKLSPVWCSASTPTFSPKPGCEPAFQRLVDIAKATTIHIVFDFNQLHQHYQSSFKAFGKAARGLSGYPVEASLIERGLRKASWEVFAPTEVTGAPPAYKSSKRRRQESPSSPLQPPRCWTPQSPAAESHTTEKTIPISPGAEAAALRLAQLEYHTNLTNAIVGERLAAHIEQLNASQAEAIEAAVARRLDAYFGRPLHAETIDAAVDRQVDAVVQARLPNVVQNLLVPKDLPSSPSTSFTHDDHGNSYPKLPPLTPAGQALLPHLRTHLTDQFKLLQQQQLQRFEKLVSEKYNEVEMAAEDNRVREQAEWEEEREEHNVEVALQRRDTLHDLWMQGTDMLEQAETVCSMFQGDIDEQLTKLCDKIEVLRKNVDNLNAYSLRKLMAAEVAKLPKHERRMKGIPKGFGRSLLTHPDPKLLMKKRIEDSEWEDI
ncbi:hypothetical protein OPT61_g4626 [Boeremia exigua]|uniref:Uncharacterized protein n=1 Tax=Boeremia exigua TaxID=749465 RepID=A0ACC2IDH6_9PLEO|nr:hypothetical protein OPT61_g4626 [Boeremia exigua]